MARSYTNRLASNVAGRLELRMGRYITPTDLRRLLPGTWIEEYLRTAPIEGPDGRRVGYEPATDDQLAPFIEAAENEADAYIGVFYGLPLPQVPPMLPQVIADICRYRISTDNPTESIRLRYQDAVAFLGKVAAGKAALAVRYDNSVQPGSARVMAGRVASRNLDRTTMASWGFL